mgnify:CR=1 FL=1
MRIEELKSELLGKTYPNEVRIHVDQVVVDVPLFLKVSFIEAEQWTRDLEKCPGWVRLIRFKEAVNALESMA